MLVGSSKILNHSLSDVFISVDIVKQLPPVIPVCCWQISQSINDWTEVWFLSTHLSSTHYT